MTLRSMRLTSEEKANKAYPGGCRCSDDSGSCDWCQVYYWHEHECIFKSGDCDICPDCGEHTEFCEECGSACCGAGAYYMD